MSPSFLLSAPCSEFFNACLFCYIFCSFNFNTLNFTFFHHSGCTDIFRDSSFSTLWAALGDRPMVFTTAVQKHNQNKHAQKRKCTSIRTLCTTPFTFLETKSLQLWPKPDGNSLFSLCVRRVRGQVALICHFLIFRMFLNMWIHLSG